MLILLWNQIDKTNLGTQKPAAKTESIFPQKTLANFAESSFVELYL